MDARDRQTFSLLLEKFDPASSLWRSLEIRQALLFLSGTSLSGPVLDLGCGEGNIAKIVFADKHTELVGLDDWQNILEQAKESKAYRHLVLADAGFLPFARNSFNAIFSNSVIEHIKNLDAVLEGVFYVLKPKGLFIFTVPTDRFGDNLFFYKFFFRIGLRRIADWYKAKRIHLLNHYNLFSELQWRKRLASFGFRVIYSGHYLSDNALFAWDLVAALGFILKKLRLDFVIPLFKKLIRPYLAGVLERDCATDQLSKDNSAGLFVVAQLS